MLNSIEKDLIIFMVAYHSDYSFENLIKKINSNIKIIIIENSNLKSTKEYFENKYKNVKVVLNKINTGQTGGINSGFKNISSKYALYLDMDVDFDSGTIEKFYRYAEQIKDFIILSPPNYNRDYPKSFYYQKNNINNEIVRMNIVHGHFLFFKMSSVLNVGQYDEKIFMYYDETDYCLRATKMNEKVYIIKNTKVMHKEGKSYEIGLMQKIQNVRHWHIMWSKYYFFNKHYGLLRALVEIVPDLLESVVKILILFFINKFKYQIYKNRLSGLINSILGKSSWKRL